MHTHSNFAPVEIALRIILCAICVASSIDGLAIHLKGIPFSIAGVFSFLTISGSVVTLIIPKHNWLSLVLLVLNHCISSLRAFCEN